VLDDEQSGSYSGPEVALTDFQWVTFHLDEKSACRPVEISNRCQLSSKPVFLVKADYFRLVCHPDIIHYLSVWESIS
jgi:hypothetical protein